MSTVASPCGSIHPWMGAVGRARVAPVAFPALAAFTAAGPKGMVRDNWAAESCTGTNAVRSGHRLSPVGTRSRDGTGNRHRHHVIQPAL